jgi:flagellar motor switch protein FliG
VIFGKEKVAKILSRLKTPDSKRILQTIALKNGKLADEIRELMFTFEDLVALSERDMQLLHAKIDKNDLLLSMKGATHELREHLLSGISTKKKTMLSEELELMGAVKRSDVEAARQRMTEMVRDMIESGEISLDDEWIE